MNAFLTFWNGCTYPASRFAPLALAACCLLATGCASTGKTTAREAFKTKLGQFNSALVEVESTAGKTPEKMNAFKVQLESRIIAKLREQKAFQKIYSQAADADAQAQIGITVSITNVRDVDTFDRVMWGAMAGQANTKAIVEVRERASNSLLGASEIVGKSSGGSVMAGTTTEAVDRVADEVVKVIMENL